MALIFFDQEYPANHLLGHTSQTNKINVRALTVAHMSSKKEHYCLSEYRRLTTLICGRLGKLFYFDALGFSFVLSRRLCFLT